MKFLDFFAGIGGFRRGMELAGHKCVGFCECDKFAYGSYVSMHLLTEEQRERLMTMPKNKRIKEIGKEEYRNGEWYARDIREIRADHVPGAECWCFGFPCQDISVAGKQLGFRGERSSLFFAVMRIYTRHQKKKIDPHTYLLRTLKTYLVLMEERTSLNFSLRWTKLGMMQNGRFSIPLISECRKTGKGCSLWDIIEENADPKYFLSMEQMEKIMWNR